MANPGEQRPPYITFEVMEVEDRAASMKEGQYRTKDVEHIVIVPHGSEGRTKIVEVYSEWLKKMKSTDWSEKYAPGTSKGDGAPMMDARFDQSWISKIEAAYENWKRGVKMMVEGAPLQNWPAISPAQRTACFNAHLHTVEELASASEQALDLLGMGGRTLQNRAKDWLQMRDSDPSKSAAQMEALRVEKENMEVRVKSLEEQNRALSLKLEELTAKA